MNTFARSSLVLIVSLAFALGTHLAFAQYQYMPKAPGGMQQQMRLKQQQQQNYQNPNNPAQQQQQQFSGTIDQIVPQGIVVDANGQKWNVAAPKNCQVQISGTGDASLLKQGMFVRFSADVDKKSGKTSAPVAEIEVTSPQSAVAAGARTALKTTSPAATAGPSSVVGTIKSVSAKDITVEGPNGSVKADLSPSTNVKIESSDPHLAQVGDKVEVQGTLVKQPNYVMARSIHITLGSGDKAPAGKPNEKPAAATN